MKSSSLVGLSCGPLEHKAGGDTAYLILQALTPQKTFSQAGRLPDKRLFAALVNCIKCVHVSCAYYTSGPS